MREFDEFTYYDKQSKERVPTCPIPWSYRWQKDEEDNWQSIPYSQVRRYREGGLCCPIPQDHRSPRLDGQNYIALTNFFAKKNHPDWHELKAVPIIFYEAP